MFSNFLVTHVPELGVECKDRYSWCFYKWLQIILGFGGNSPIFVSFPVFWNRQNSVLTWPKIFDTLINEICVALLGRNSQVKIKLTRRVFLLTYFPVPHHFNFLIWWWNMTNMMCSENRDWDRPNLDLSLWLMSSSQMLGTVEKHCACIAESGWAPAYEHLTSLTMTHSWCYSERTKTHN
jgi:hypothetical protein